MKWLRLAPALLLGATACGEPETEASPDRETGPLRAIAAVVVGEGQAGGVYRAVGVVRARRRAELATRGMGRIETVRVRAGDRVRAGQVLATIDRASQLASREQTSAALELATANLRRMERLYADSAVPIAQLEAARAQFAQAQGQANAVGAELAYADLVAPFAGVVTARLADPGDLAAPGQPVLVVEDQQAPEIVVAAPDRVAAATRPGALLPVEIGSEGRRITARVVAVVPAADPATRAVEIRLTADERLASNLTAVALIPVAGAEPAPLTVPLTAVIERGQLTGVLLFAPDSTVRLRWIRLGRRTADHAEVVSGLVAGDVVARHASEARDGEPARPVLELGAAQ